MDNFVRQHLAVDGASAGPLTMGYYERGDLPLHYALADAFTLCDNYHCSVIGPSDPNHLMSISGTIDPNGTGGGPVVETFGVPAREEEYFKLTWTTMPEQLQARGISWKVYSLDNISPLADPVFIYFKKYLTNPKLAARALLPSFPAGFLKDIAFGTLPHVSWIYTPFVETAHPPTPVAYDEAAISQVIQALLAKPALWAKTALFITYDENGGFFDHVAPPVPPPGTPGEFLTAASLPAAAQGIRGPVGLGFRVPMMVISPFSRGGFVSSDTFDHTSMLRFLETRFGAEVPNLSAWRRSVTGDLTSAFNFAAVDTSKPTLPKESLLNIEVLGSNCVAEAAAGILDEIGISQLDSTIESVAANYMVPPPPQSVPPQEPGTARRPSGPVACRTGLLGL
jgi:phospholipase C